MANPRVLVENYLPKDFVEDYLPDNFKEMIKNNNYKGVEKELFNKLTEFLINEVQMNPDIAAIGQPIKDYTKQLLCSGKVKSKNILAAYISVESLKVRLCALLFLFNEILSCHKGHQPSTILLEKYNEVEIYLKERGAETLLEMMVDARKLFPVSTRISTLETRTDEAKNELNQMKTEIQQFKNTQADMQQQIARNVETTANALARIQQQIDTNAATAVAAQTQIQEQMVRTTGLQIQLHQQMTTTTTVQTQMMGQLTLLTDMMSRMAPVRLTTPPYYAGAAENQVPSSSSNHGGFFRRG